MNRLIRLITALSIMPAAASCSNAGIPEMPGAGVAAHYAAGLDGKVIVAGGCNFPDRPPYEGGSKAFYDDILLLCPGGWKKTGRLPRTSAYGAYASDGKALFIAGGADGDGAHDSFIAIALDGRKPVIKLLPSLPKDIQQGAASFDDGKIYVAGGFGTEGPNRDVLRYDMSQEDWDIVASLPQALVQPVMTVHGGIIYIWGGYDPETRKSVTCGFRFEDGAWSEIPGAPDGGTMVGSASVKDGDFLYITGGVNNEIFDHALTLGPEETAVYQSQPVEYYRFREKVFRFDLKSETWSDAGTWHDSARAGASLILKDGHLISMGGEIKACVRDPRSFSFKPDPGQ